MKLYLQLITILGVFLLVGCSIRPHASYKYIQDHGGMEFGTPLKVDDDYYIPIKCYASGMKKVTVEPNETLPYPVFYTDYAIDIEENQIDLKLYAEVRERQRGSFDIASIKLGDIPRGLYKLYYIDTDNSKIFIKEIELQ